MTTKIFFLCAIVQAFISSVYSKQKVNVTLDLLKNPEIDNILDIAGKRLEKCLSAAAENDEQSYEEFDQAWLNKAQVKVIDGIKNYKIKAKFNPSLVGRRSYTHLDCVIQAKGNSVKSVRVNCYFFEDGEGCVYYYDTNESLLRDCHHNVIQVFENPKC